MSIDDKLTIVAVLQMLTIFTVLIFHLLRK
jgi:hypothetical protein